MNAHALSPYYGFPFEGPIDQDWIEKEILPKLNGRTLAILSLGNKKIHREISSIITSSDVLAQLWLEAMAMKMKGEQLNPTYGVIARPRFVRAPEEYSEPFEVECLCLPIIATHRIAMWSLEKSAISNEVEFIAYGPQKEVRLKCLLDKFPNLSSGLIYNPFHKLLLGCNPEYGFGWLWDLTTGTFINTDCLDEPIRCAGFGTKYELVMHNKLIFKNSAESYYNEREGDLIVYRVHQPNSGSTELQQLAHLHLESHGEMIFINTCLLANGIAAVWEKCITQHNKYDLITVYRLTQLQTSFEKLSSFRFEPEPNVTLFELIPNPGSPALIILTEFVAIGWSGNEEKQTYAEVHCIRDDRIIKVGGEIQLLGQERPQFYDDSQHVLVISDLTTKSSRSVTLCKR